MIPLISIGKFIAIILVCFTARKVYKIWQKEKQDEFLKYFFNGLLLTAAAFVFYVFFPLIKNLYFVQALFYLQDTLVVLVVYCFVLFFLHFLNLHKFQKLLPWLTVSGIFVLLSFYVKYFNPAIIFYYNFLELQLIGWAPDLPHIIRILLFGIIGGIGFVFVALFLKKTFSFPDHYLKIRGIFFMLGIISLWLAGMFCVLSGAFRPMNFLGELFHALFSILTPIFFLLFVSYKKPGSKKLL